MSGLGKGIFSSSLAKLLQDKGLKVAPIKMEGYCNIDSGTLNPYRHGEVFVLDDGMETDMDLGTYERLLDQDLSAANFTTNGQIMSAVLEEGTRRQLPGPRRAVHSARHRRSETEAARTGRQEPRPMWSSSKSAARSGIWKTRFISKRAVSLLMKKAKNSVVLRRADLCAGTRRAGRAEIQGGAAWASSG